MIASARQSALRFTAFTLAVALVSITGCQKTEPESGGADRPAAGAGVPPGHPPFQGGMPGMTDAQGPTDGHEVALKATGLNSAEELSRAQAKLGDQGLARDFEMAFRYSFSARQAQRNYPESVQLANKVVEAHPDFAPAYRVLGYALFNTGQQSQSLAAYRKAVELDPNYGEAHYALAFMYAMGDKETGAVHYRKAMELGIPDERDLGNRFYGGGSQ